MGSVECKQIGGRIGEDVNSGTDVVEVVAAAEHSVAAWVAQPGAPIGKMYVDC